MGESGGCFRGGDWWSWMCVGTGEVVGLEGWWSWRGVGARRETELKG